MYFIKIIIGAACLLYVHKITCEELDLPPYFKKCSKTDRNVSNCILENIKSSWPILAKGDEKYHLHSLDPLSIPHMHVSVDENLYGNLTNGIFTGFSNATLFEVKADLEKRRFEFIYLVPLANIGGDFQLFGRLLSINIGGEGKTNVTFINGTQRFYFDYELIERKGKHYINITDNNLENLTLEGSHFNVEFANNNSFGDALNKVLNENWRELKPYISASVGKGFSEVFTVILNSFFRKVPYDNLFSD